MAEDNASQTVDAVLTALGWRGRYQMIQLVQLLLSIFPIGFHILSIVFIGKMNEHTCRPVDNVTSHTIPSDVTNMTYGKCSVTWLNVSGETMEIPCPNGLQFNEPKDRSLVSEWRLVCENEVLTDVSQTILLTGMVVGAVLFTILADRYGRKPIYIVSHLAMTAVGLVTAFVPTFGAFLPLRFLLGALQQGTGLTAGILQMEIVPARRRFIINSCGSFLWSSGMVFLAILAFLMRSVSWRYLQILLSAFSLYCVIQIWFTDESLRWLVANGKVKKAERILKKAARINGVNESDILHLFRTKTLGQNNMLSNNADQKVDDTDSSVEDPNGKQHTDTINEIITQKKASLPKLGLLDFCRHRYILMCTIINSFAWFVNSVTYYGLSMTSVTLADDMYLGFFLSAIVEIPNALAFLLLVERLGRKRLCEIFHAVAGISLLLSVALPSLLEDKKVVGIAVTALSLVGKFAISCTFATLFLYTPEQFPTNLRNASLGIASMAARVGGMVAPYSRTLIRHYPWAPGTIFGACCLTLPFLMRILPETRGRELPQTIEQMQQMTELTPIPKDVHQKAESSSKDINGDSLVALS